MTIKGTSTSVSLKNIPFIFFISALVGIVLRSFQMLKFIDSETGFYTGGKFVTVILYGVIFACFLTFCVKAFLSAESEKIQVQGIKNKPLGIATFVFSVSLVFDFLSGFSASGDAELAYDFKGLMLTGTMPRFLQSIFALVSAVYFIIVAKDFIKGTSKASKHRVLATMPIGWAGFRMVCRFVRQISFVKVSDLLLELLMLALMLLFFMAFAQVASGVYSDGFRWRIPSFGASAALIAATLSVPRLIFTLVNFERYINSQHTFQITDFAFVIFALMLISTVCKELVPYTAYDEIKDEDA